MIGCLGRRRVGQKLFAVLHRPPGLRGSTLVRFSGSSRLFSSQEATQSSFAVVDHAEAYESAMQGRHGKQLSLSQIDAIGKDDPPFDPFIEDELMEEYEEDEDNEDQEGDGVERDEEESEVVERDDSLASDQDEDISQYTADGSLRWKKSQLAAFRAGAPAGGLFAVVRLAGSQHKVTTDDVLIVSKVNPVDTYAIGSIHTLKDVLLVSSSHLSLIGMPLVEGAEVDVMVEEITQDEKLIVFKNRRRKNSKRKKGFRRDVTMLRVLDIRMPYPYQNHMHNERDSVDES